MLSVAEAKARVLEGVIPLDPESLSIYHAAGRVLAQDLAAQLTQPPFAASAMDGYAVCSGDVLSAPVSLRVIGESAAGHGFSGKVSPGEAVRIFTGAPLPDGAGTVVIQENTKVEAPGEVTIQEPAAPGRNVRSRGYDFHEGEVLLKAGTRLGPPHLMLAAAMNYPAVPVYRRPLVAILANGDELVPPGTAPKPSQIVSSIPAGLKAAIEAWGGEALMLAIADDRKESIAALCAEAAHADILVTIGGASVGDHDLVRATLEAKGAVFGVLKAAMRPGKPIMSGQSGAQRVIGLPGNPGSAFVCARVFLKPLIAALLGLNADEPVSHQPLSVAVEPNGSREHYMRATFAGGTVTPLPDQDSSLVAAFAQANCLIIRPVNAPSLPAGAPVPIIPL
jgi:molybdopterin molybdotransferase